MDNSLAAHSSLDIRVIPLLCPGCGNPLPAGEDDVIFVCASCAASWELVDGSLVRRELYHLAGKGDVRLPFWILPFWILPFQVTTREGVVEILAAYRNLTGSLPVGNGGVDAVSPNLFVPACPFSSPTHLVRAGRLLTLRQPSVTPVPCRPERIAPIVFREEDARNMGEVILLATVTEERKKSFAFLESFSFRPAKGMLFTIPFEEKGSKFYHAGMNLEL
jgi:hypothetical protein